MKDNLADMADMAEADMAGMVDEDSVAIVAGDFRSSSLDSHFSILTLFITKN